MKLIRVQKWFQGKHTVPATVSALMVLHADLLYTYFDQFLNHKMAEQFPVVDSTKWLKFHKKHFKFYRDKDNSLYHSKESTNRLLELLGPLLDRFNEKVMQPYLKNRKSEPPKLDFAEEISFIDKWIISSFLNNFQYDDLYKDLPNSLVKQLWKPHSQTYTEAYFLKIAVPSVVFYKIHPAFLLRKARQGDLEALTQILVLDTTLIYDKRIQQLWGHESNKRSSVRFKRILNALATTTPKIKFSKQKLKIVMAGFIEFVFKLYKQPISRTEIRLLFDSFCEDTGRGIIDTDLPEGEQALSMAIKREIKTYETARNCFRFASL